MAERLSEIIVKNYYLYFMVEWQRRKIFGTSGLGLRFGFERDILTAFAEQLSGRAAEQQKL